MKLSPVQSLPVALLMLSGPLFASDDAVTVSLVASDAGICAVAEADDKKLLIDLGLTPSCEDRFNNDGKPDLAITSDAPLTEPQTEGALALYPIALERFHADVKGIAYRLEYGNLSLLLVVETDTLKYLNSEADCAALGISVDRTTAFDLDNPLMVVVGDTALPACLIELVKPHIAVTDQDRNGELVKLGFQSSNVLSLAAPHQSNTDCQIPEGVEVSLGSDGKMTVYYCAHRSRSRYLYKENF